MDPYASVRVVVSAARRRVADLLGGREARAAVETSRALMAAVPAGILRMDPDGSLVYANERFRALWHLPPDQTAAEIDWARSVHPDDVERVVSGWRAALEGDGAYDSEFRIMAPDGSSRWTWTRTVSEDDATGKRIGLLAAAIDVHERHRAEEALSRSERLHRLTINSLPGVIVGLYDRELRCVLMEGEGADARLNTAACVGRTLGEFANRETADLLEPGMRDALLHGRERSYCYRSPRDDTYRENHVGPLRTAEGEIDGVVIVSRDVTTSRVAEEARRAADEQFRIAFDQAPIGIASIGLDGRLERVNQALSDMTGYSAGELSTVVPSTLIHVDDLVAVRARADEIYAGESFATEFRMTHARGHIVWVDARVALIRDQHGAPVQLLAQVQDISERRHYAERLEHMADHDPLTGLLNRRGLERELHAQLARTRREDRGGTLAVLDLDGFKQVNDTLGHAAGDQLIVDVSNLLRGRLRETDMIARMGGDEFALILPAESAESAAIVARALLETIRELVTEEHAGQVTASMGLAAFEGHLTADQMFARADRAMYDAKETGKDRVAVYAELVA